HAPARLGEAAHCRLGAELGTGWCPLAPGRAVRHAVLRRAGGPQMALERKSARREESRAAGPGSALRGLASRAVRSSLGWRAASGVRADVANLGGSSVDHQHVACLPTSTES